MVEEPIAAGGAACSRLGVLTPLLSEQDVHLLLNVECELKRAEIAEVCDCI